MAKLPTKLGTSEGWKLETCIHEGKINPPIMGHQQNDYHNSTSCDTVISFSHPLENALFRDGFRLLFLWSLPPKKSWGEPGTATTFIKRSKAKKMLAPQNAEVEDPCEVNLFGNRRKRFSKTVLEETSI